MDGILILLWEHLLIDHLSDLIPNEEGLLKGPINHYKDVFEGLEKREISFLHLMHIEKFLLHFFELVIVHFLLSQYVLVEFFI